MAGRATCGHHDRRVLAGAVGHVHVVHGRGGQQVRELRCVGRVAILAHPRLACAHARARASEPASICLAGRTSELRCVLALLCRRVRSTAEIRLPRHCGSQTVLVLMHETRAAHGALSSAPCKCGGCRLLGACRAASCLPSATSTAAVCLHKVVLLGHGIGGAAGLRGCRVCASTVLSQWVRLQRRTVHATPNSSDRASTAHAERCSSLAAVQQRLALLRRSPASPRVAKRRRWRTASSMTSTVWTAVNINRVGSAQRAQPPRAGAPSLLAPTVAFCVRAWLACAARQRVTIGL